MRRLWFLLSLLVLIPPVALSAQSLSIGGVSLSFGDNFGAVTTNLRRAGFELRPSSDSSYVGVWFGKSQLGSVNFSARSTAVFIQKNFDEDGEPMPTRLERRTRAWLEFQRLTSAEECFQSMDSSLLGGSGAIRTALTIRCGAYSFHFNVIVMDNDQAIISTQIILGAPE